MHGLTVVIVIAALLGSAARVDAVSVRGGRSCGEWVADQEKAKRSGADASSLVATANASADEAWLLGYLSGFAIGTGKDVLNETHPKSVSLWMDNYCKANPLDPVSKGARSLAIELAERQR